MPLSKPIRVLCVDGGGIRGVIPCKVLEFIEAYTGKRIYELFDLVAGTSTGALLACGLTMPAPKTAAQMRDIYLKQGNRIFSRSWSESIWKLGGLTGPKYGAEGIDAVLREEFGDVRLTECLIPTMATAYEVQVRKPVFFTSWANGYNLIRDVCRASSAGPTFFPPASFGEVPLPPGLYIDGGTVCNNPAIVALTEASKFYGVERSQILMLSLGTGADEQALGPEVMKWGQLTWVRPLISILMDGVSTLNAHIMSEVLPKENYLRLQAVVSGSMGDMDNTDPRNLSLLERAGQQLVDINRVRLMKLCDRLTD